jgi:hypothetical protein
MVARHTALTVLGAVLHEAAHRVARIRGVQATCRCDGDYNARGGVFRHANRGR